MLKHHYKKMYIFNNIFIVTIISVHGLDLLQYRQSKMDYIKRPRRAVLTKIEKLWDYGVIPYEIDKKLPAHLAFMFKRAMRYWENVSCVNFIERNISIHTNYVYFTRSSCGCCSLVGKDGTGLQIISIGRNCEKFGIVLHEIGHTIGFFHEHNRHDRNDYIQINYDNIMPGQSYNFDIDKNSNSYGLPYDYNSIMHYGPKHLSKNGLDTIRTTKGYNHDIIQIGQRVKLSKTDILQVNLLYKCPKCGKTLQSPVGTIMAPHFNLIHDVLDDEYNEYNESDISNKRGRLENSAIKCEWRIIANSEERVELHIHQVHLFETENCTQDYLEIRDGYWHKSPLIKRLCGNITNLILQSESNRMLIVYNNRRKSFKGFKADYKIICDRDIYLSWDKRSDAINSPGYLSNKICIWRIMAPLKYQISIKFNLFELEYQDKCLYDYLEIFDGYTSDAKLLKTLCGESIPQDVKSKTNEMYLRFVTDDSVESKGFSAIVMLEYDECRVDNYGCEHNCTKTFNGYRCECLAGYELHANGKNCSFSCGGVIDVINNNGILTSPFYPDFYPNSKRCVWDLMAPENHTLYLNFTHFDLEPDCSYDYLLILSRLSEKHYWKKRGTYCGQDLPPPIEIEKGTIRLKFITDTAVQHTGFMINYKIDANECAMDNAGCDHLCHNTLGSFKCSCRKGFILSLNGKSCVETSCKYIINDTQGIIHSPNYPNNYLNNLYCYWNWSTIHGHRIRLTFQEFHLENHQECIYDSVVVHDGPDYNSSTLGNYCSKLMPFTITSSLNYLFMVFTSDSHSQYKGFYANYTTECGSYLGVMERKQILHSHIGFNEKIPYNHNVYCEWRLQTLDIDQSIRIEFTYFSLEYHDNCLYDFVEIYEEPNGYHDTIYGKYCGDIKPPALVSYSDTIFIRFKTDNTIAFQGFNMIFWSVHSPYDELV